MTLMGEGEVFAYSRNWKLVLIAEANSSIILRFSGTWTVNPKSPTPFVDYRGVPGSSSPSHYRGPQLPEGCMLLKGQGGKIYHVAKQDWKLAFNEETKIYLAANDGTTREALRDNDGKISYVFYYQK